MPVVTPHIGSKELYVTSGHYEKYGADSFQPIKTPNPGEEFFLKPMNCPHHCEIYKTEPRSYRDLPVRLAEFGTVYRYEQSGELHGLTRVRGFTQDDAHIFCRPDQVKEEFMKVIDIVLYVLKALDFPDFTAQISLRDPANKTKYIGSDENWEKAESAIQEAALEKGLTTVTELGEAAFYGPKLDFHGARRHRPPLAARHHSGRLQPARAVRPRIHRRRQLQAAPGDDSPRPLRLARALRGRAHRALRRQLPALAHARAVHRAAHLRQVSRLRPRGESPARAARPARHR